MPWNQLGLPFTGSYGKSMAVGTKNGYIYLAIVNGGLGTIDTTSSQTITNSLKGWLINTIYGTNMPAYAFYKSTEEISETLQAPLTFTQYPIISGQLGGSFLSFGGMPAINRDGVFIGPLIPPVKNIAFDGTVYEPNSDGLVTIPSTYTADLLWSGSINGGNTINVPNLSKYGMVLLDVAMASFYQTVFPAIKYNSGLLVIGKNSARPSNTSSYVVGSLNLTCQISGDSITFPAGGITMNTISPSGSEGVNTANQTLYNIYGVKF
jgi:hypothetical protein